MHSGSIAQRWTELVIESPFESDCKAKFDRDRIVNNSTGKLKMDTGRDVVRVLRPCFHGGALCDVWILHNSDNSGGF